MFEWYGHGGGPGWIFLGFVNVALWVAIIAVVISLLRPRHREGCWHGTPPVTSSRSPERSSAQTILQERLARGEISEDDYRRLSELLRDS